MANLYLFDTNILVHVIRDDITGQLIRSTYSPFLIDPKPFYCVVSDGELRSLALQWFWGDQKTDQMRFVLSHFRRIPIEKPDVLQTYALIDFFSKSKGIKMGKNDLWVASAAHIAGSRLVTTDIDFDHLDSVFVSVDKIPLS